LARTVGTIWHGASVRSFFTLRRTSYVLEGVRDGLIAMREGEAQELGSTFQRFWEGERLDLLSMSTKTSQEKT